MKVLVVEDWWADRVRFELLLSAQPNIEVTFAWKAGRRSGVWPVEQIVDAVVQHDAVLLDMALTRGDEDIFLDVRRRSSREADELDANAIGTISGIQVLERLANREQADRVDAGTYTRRCIIVSAYTYDVFKRHAATRWRVRDTFHKWLDEDRIVERLFNV